MLGAFLTGTFFLKNLHKRRHFLVMLSRSMLLKVFP